MKAIGRLDMNTEGLLLVTNCGDYARAMELPSHQIHRVYRARVHGHVHPYKLQAMRRTVRIPKSLTTSTTQRDQDTKPKKHRQKPNSTKLLPQTPPHQHQQHGSDYYAPMKVELEQTRKRAEATNQWLKITCSEGKNRQIRNVLKHFGCKCVRVCV